MKPGDIVKRRSSWMTHDWRSWCAINNVDIAGVCEVQQVRGDKFSAWMGERVCWFSQERFEPALSADDNLGSLL